MNNKLQYIATIFLVLLLSACSGDDKKSSVEESAKSTTIDTSSTALTTITFTADQYQLSGIETGTIQNRELSNIIKLNGIIDVEPSNVASVSAPLGGFIKTAGLLPGQPVKKGQVLATVENPEFINLQQEYMESLGKLQYLEQEYKRQQTLREQDVNAAKTLQQVTSDYKVMQARVNGLEQKLALAGISSSALQQGGKISRTANIYAPISGFVTASNVNIGKYVNPTDVLFELENRSDLHLALNALEKDITKVKVGQTVKFSLANENNYNRLASVFLIGKATNNDRNIPVHCHLAKQDESALLPGMYVKAWIETGASSQPSVPIDAIIQLEGKDYIVSLVSQSQNGYTFELIQILKATEQEGYAGITLPEDINIVSAKIVTKNAYAILSAIKNAEEEE
ncbi:MAG: efflux RND transporter periplasmic adaptor subunit [Sphingobacteriales bacterium]|nr:efflux RND transporter periplasmic adaptor subunit [Sphingobacteriales bacterium]OJW35588.1 MAG: efflux transporter periplasmic adaptor subunit [Sphingobacteriales bacterium 46-32]